MKVVVVVVVVLQLELCGRGIGEVLRLTTTPVLTFRDRLVGLVASRAEDPGFESHLRRDFFWVESYQ